MAGGGGHTRDTEEGTGDIPHGGGGEVGGGTTRRRRCKASEEGVPRPLPCVIFDAMANFDTAFHTKRDCTKGRRSGEGAGVVKRIDDAFEGEGAKESSGVSARHAVHGHDDLEKGEEEGAAEEVQEVADESSQVVEGGLDGVVQKRIESVQTKPMRAIAFHGGGLSAAHSWSPAEGEGWNAAAGLTVRVGNEERGGQART
jgi:hypothetical protein